MTELREKINDIILSYCEGHYHLEFTEDDLPNILNEIEEAINYNRCCTQLKDKKPISFEEYKETWFVKENEIIYFDKLTTEFIDINEIMKKYQEYYLRF